MAMKWKKAGLLIALLMSLLSLVAMILFLYVQKVNGNPDSGKEFVQLYFPIMVFMAFAATGIICSIKLSKEVK